MHSTEGSEGPGPKQTPARDMLYDLANDIGEQHDLAAKQPKKLAELKKQYEAWSAAGRCRLQNAWPHPKVWQSRRVRGDAVTSASAVDLNTPMCTLPRGKALLLWV